MNNLANNELTNYSVWPLSFPFSILIMVKSELIEFFFLTSVKCKLTLFATLPLRTQIYQNGKVLI